MLGNVRQGHNVIIARAHSSFSRVSAVAIAMIASICAAARLRQGIAPLRGRSCVVFGESTHLTLLLNTAEGKRDIPRPKHDGALQQVKLLGTEP